MENEMIVDIRKFVMKQPFEWYENKSEKELIREYWDQYIESCEMRAPETGMETF